MARARFADRDKRDRNPSASPCHPDGVAPRGFLPHGCQNSGLDQIAQLTEHTTSRNPAR